MGISSKPSRKHDIKIYIYSGEGKGGVPTLSPRQIPDFPLPRLITKDDPDKS